MSGFITQETIDAVRQTADIESVIGEFTKLTRRTGNKAWGCCPFHNEKTPSFQVDLEKNFYYCYGCKATGDVIKFIMEMEKISYPEAITNLATRFGIPIKYTNNYNPETDNARKHQDEIDENIRLYEGVATSFHYMLTQTPQGKAALDYVKKRGLTDETIEKFRLGYAPSDPKWLKHFLKSKNYSEEFLNHAGLFSPKYPDYAVFCNRLMFPIFNKKGKVVAFGGRVIPPADESQRKYVNSPELIQFKKRETLFGFNFAKETIRKTNRILFCEGNMDVIAYHQCGIEYAVATLGTAFTEDHIKLIKGFVADGAVYLSFDSDNAGRMATWKGIKLCREHNLTVKIVRLSGGKDPAEIMLKYGSENLTMQVENSILDSDYLLLRLGEKYALDTPEGKHRAALEFFQYIDVLQSDIQKESSLEQLSQALNIKPEAVKRDFLNRKEVHKRLNNRQNNHQTEENKKISLNAELRGLIAVLADLDQFKIVRTQLSASDFQNPVAKDLYLLLEECFNNNSLSIPDILNRCEKELSQIITDEISSDIYLAGNVDIVIQDAIKMIKKNSLDRQRDLLLKRIKDYVVITDDDQEQLNILIKQKLELDKQAQTILQ